MILGALKIALGIDARGLEEGRAEIREFMRVAEHELNSLEATLKRRSQRFIDLGRSLTFAVTAPLGALATLGIKQAIEAEQAGRRFAAAFGADAERVLGVLDRMGAQIPEGTSDLQRMAATVQDLQRNMGIAARPAEQMSLALIGIANAVSKIKGGRTLDVFNALSAGMSGNTRGLKEFGIVIDENLVKQEAFNLGILKQGQQLTAAGRAVATFNLIQKQTARVQEEAARATESPARQLQRLKVEMVDMAEELGRRLLPSFLAFGRLVTQVAGAFARLDPNLQNSVIALAAMASAVGPLIFLFGQLHRILTLVVINGIRGLAVALTGLAISPGGALLIGLGLLAGAFLLIKNRLDDASRSVQRLKGELGALTELELLRKSNDERDRELVLRAKAAKLQEDLAAALKKVPKGTRGDFLPVATQRLTEELSATNRELALQQNRVAAVNQQYAELARISNQIDPGDGLFGDDQLSAIEQLAQRAQLLAERFELVGDASKLTRDYWTEIDSIIAQAQSIFAAQGGAINDASNGALEILAAFRELQAQKPPRFIEIMGNNLQTVIDRLREGVGAVSTGPAFAGFQPGIEASITGLERAATRFARLKDEMDVALVSGSTVAVDRIKRDMEELQEFARRLGKTLAIAIQGAGLPEADRARALQAIRDAFASLGIEIDATSQPLSKLEQLLQSLEQTGNSVLSSLATGFGSLADSIGKTLRSVLVLVGGIASAADAIKKIRKEREAAKAAGGSTLGSLASIGQLAGGVIAIGSAVASLASSLFGRTRRESELVEALRNNADSITRAMLELTGTLKRPANLLRAQNAATSLAPVIADLFNNKAFLGSSRFEQNKQINALLSDFGFTIAELNTIAADNGIQLLDSSGRVIAASFEQLAEMLGFSIQALTQWGKSLDAQRAKLDLRDLVNNVAQSPLKTIERELALLSESGSPLAVMFADLQATTRAGREQFRAALGHILDIIEAGALDAHLLGDLGGLDDLTSIVRGLAGALNEMDGATRSLTESLTNAPTGFRIAAARFNASTPQTSSLASNALPGVLGGQVNVTFAAGSIVQAPGEDAEGLANRVIGVIEQRARRRSGTPVTGIS